MARKPVKAGPRPPKWHEHTAIRILGIVVPVLILIFLGLFLATRQRRFNALPDLESSKPTSTEAFFAGRPEGIVGGPAPESASSSATGDSKRSLLSLDAQQEQLHRIQSDVRFARATLDQIYDVQQDRSLSPVQREEFENRLMGSRVLWQGVVEQINPQNNGTVELTIHTVEDGFHRAFLQFPRSERKKLRLLRVEQQVEITGVVTSIVGWPFLEDCFILRSWELEKQQTQVAASSNEVPLTEFIQKLGR